ncbi:MAG: hypothetical protein K6G09_10555 [Treponema sp.]|nr:hypothetical protein [Treponema sp.]
MRKIIFITVFLFVSLFAYSEASREYEHFMDKGFVVKLNADYEVNCWIPEPSSCFKYTTKGLQLAKYDIDITGKYFPRLNVTWETSFSLDGSNNKALFYEHQKNDGLKEVYNKIKIVVGLGSLVRSIGTNSYYNPWKNNYRFSLAYNRETFRIGVTPRYSGLRYCDFEGHLSGMEYDRTYWQYTKFEEIDLDINTGGKMMLPALYSLLFEGDYIGVGSTSLDTTVGPYVSWWQKPYNTRQIISGGTSTGNANTVYSAKFYSIGAVEKWCYAGERFYFNNQLNWGLALVRLSEGEVLIDSSSPIYMQFNIIPEVGYHFPILNHRLIFSGYAKLNWGCLAGITFNTKSDSDALLDFAAFINGDVLLQASLALTVLF